MRLRLTAEAQDEAERVGGKTDVGIGGDTETKTRCESRGGG